MSNNHNSYYYPQNQQSQGSRYSAYATASANAGAQQPSRSHERAPPAGASQSTDYMSYNPSPPYTAQASGYGGGPGGSWGSSNYGGNRETTRGAAEVLRNLSNNTYAISTGAADSSSFTPTNAAFSRHYSNHNAQVQQQQDARAGSHTPHNSYAHMQNRPRSVNAIRSPAAPSNRGLPSPATVVGIPAASQRTSQLHQQTQQRSQSPAQAQYNPHNTTVPAGSTRIATMTAAPSYNDHGRRQLPSVSATPNSYSSTSYEHSDQQATASAAYNSFSTNADPYNATTTTVDPTAVYDPWPEIQRQQAAMQARRAAEDERQAAQARKADEERTRVQEPEEEVVVEEEEEEGQRSAREAQAAGQETASALAANLSEAEPSALAPSNVLSTGQGDGFGSGVGLEAEIRAMMAKMRELNNKDPALLAKIWEEERRAKVTKSPIVQNKAASQPSQAQWSAPQVANQRKKATPKQSQAAPTNGTTQARHTAAVSAPEAQPLQRHAANSTQLAAPPAVKPVGNTIWPPEKKAQVAKAASAYLTKQNPTKTITSDTILGMLESNPSYIELCEQLEKMHLRLDRAAFAKNLLAAVPDVNSASQKAQQTSGASQASGAQVNTIHVPSPAVATPAAATPRNVPALHASSHSYSSNSRFPNQLQTPAPVAEMISLKPEIRPPANKVEAARKRTFSDIIDLTAMEEDEDDDPPSKRMQADAYRYIPPGSAAPTAMKHFPPAGGAQPPVARVATPQPLLSSDRHLGSIVQPLEKKKALRRNGYNIKTIARDVLLACGRHPDQRQLNGHLDQLKTTLGVDNSADLSTLRWDIIDPGQPPKGYYRDANITLEAEDADDEYDSEDEAARAAAAGPRLVAQAVGGGGPSATSVPAMPSGTNPFKPKRGRPPRRSDPGLGVIDGRVQNLSSQTPDRPSNPTAPASAPRPTGASIGYSAFKKSTTTDPAAPKKRGRPVGWRKHIHGSAAAQAKPTPNQSTSLTQANSVVPTQPSSLRNKKTGNINEPIPVDSRSPSVSIPRYQSFKCEWLNCPAILHNLETLKKHVYKVHEKRTLREDLECLWGNCGKEVTITDPATGMRIERRESFRFVDASKWREHIEIKHFSPLSWQLGDGPASGLSDANDSASEVYLSDSQGRRVTPRVSVDPSRFATPGSSGTQPPSAGRGRGRLPKASQEQEARAAQQRAIEVKERIGGPGIDRGGASLVNDKRRKGFADEEPEEDFVDVQE